MSILTQGTQVFMIDPDDETAIIKIPGVTAFNPGGNPRDQIEDTSLEATTSRTYKKGLGTPGQASLTVNADPQEPAHLQLYDLANDSVDRNIKFVVGMSDGTEPPTVTTGEFTLPTTRSWFAFEGYIADFPFDFATNSVVSSQVSIQRSGDGVWTKKGAPAA
ncbi:phage tail tube protein [Halomonas sp. HP20-15]|uniref:phage tail tube protein n=1 Tax=Halomonas sp. HP20-15 TaxID=3085901 RepID=UPI002981C3D8|nr:phage tail tube protein [Halomonas sp. HP20-15]MDW5376840.1 phage tail tube protein [Halomonas sp. HP20-15]